MMNQIFIMGRLSYVGKEYITLGTSKQEMEDQKIATFQELADFIEAKLN